MWPFTNSKCVYPYRVLLLGQLYQFSNFSAVYFANNSIVYYRKLVFYCFVFCNKLLIMIQHLLLCHLNSPIIP